MSMIDPTENRTAFAGGAMVHLCASFAADDHSADPWYDRVLMQL